MKELIKGIRAYLNMSQAELAELLNISFATVNRWENDRSVPNKLAQLTLYELCKEHDVPVHDMILDKIKDASENVKTDGNRELLYHGSRFGIEEPIEPKSRSKCDFGKGFYMGTEPLQALTLICDYDKSKFYIISVDLTELGVLDVPVNLEWAMLVAYHRGRMDKIKGTSLYNKYRDMANDKDIIVGCIADDRMFYVIDNFFMGNITDAALVNSLSALELGKQYVAITQKACDAARIECEVKLSYLERQFLKDVSEENRSKGVSMANEICKSHRREGMFFDELLDEALKEI
jgi:transcriptional regulator with XRE-family HTH domain